MPLPQAVGSNAHQRVRTGSVMRFIAAASFAVSQRMALVADMASTIEEDTPILVM